MNMDRDRETDINFDFLRGVIMGAAGCILVLLSALTIAQYAGKINEQSQMDCRHHAGNHDSRRRLYHLGTSLFGHRDILGHRASIYADSAGTLGQ